MVEIVPFQLDDLKPLLREPMNSNIQHWAERDYAYAKRIARGSQAFTIMISGTVYLCAFFVEIWPGRAYLVSILSEKIRSRSISIYRTIRRMLVKLPYDRIEFDCPVDLEIAHRRARFMGFQLMCAKARKYLPGGVDASVYEWVRS